MIAREDNGRKSIGFWRKRAEEARAMIDGMRDAHAKTTMEDIARKYDRMAEMVRAEESLKN